MEVNRLLGDELSYEMEIRKLSGTNAPVARRREIDREALRLERLGLADVTGMSDRDPEMELKICTEKLETLEADIQDFDIENKENDYRRIRSRLLHLRGRLSRLVETEAACLVKKSSMMQWIQQLLRELNVKYSVQPPCGTSLIEIVEDQTSPSGHPVASHENPIGQEERRLAATEATQPSTAALSDSAQGHNSVSESREETIQWNLHRQGDPPNPSAEGQELAAPNPSGTVESLPPHRYITMGHPTPLVETLEGYLVRGTISNLLPNSPGYTANRPAGSSVRGEEQQGDALRRMNPYSSSFQFAYEGTSEAFQSRIQRNWEFNLQTGNDTCDLQYNPPPTVRFQDPVVQEPQDGRP